MKVPGYLLAPSRPCESPTIVSFERRAIVERINVEDRSGVVRLRVSERQATVLIERRLVDVRGKARIMALRLKPGVAVAAVNAALRVGMRSALPIAEDCRTVRREIVAGGTVFEAAHVSAWDDGRGDATD